MSREDISDMLEMAPGERCFRVSPPHWQGGYYEIVSAPGSADIVASIMFAPFPQPLRSPFRWPRNDPRTTCSASWRRMANQALQAIDGGVR